MPNICVKASRSTAILDQEKRKRRSVAATTREFPLYKLERLGEMVLDLNNENGSF